MSQYNGKWPIGLNYVKTADNYSNAPVISARHAGAFYHFRTFSFAVLNEITTLNDQTWIPLGTLTSYFIP